MGFIRQGRFHLLFSAGLPLGDRKLGDDVPSTFQQLFVGKQEKTQPRDPGYVSARTSGELEAGLGVTVSTMQCVPSFKPPPYYFQASVTRSLEPGVNSSVELTGDRCAALATRHRTYNEDSHLDTEFSEYTKRHYRSWVKFASDKKYGKNLRPILVSGFDMAKDFAMMAYSNNHTSAQSDATFSTPMFGSVQPESASWTWRTTCIPHIKHGPQNLDPPDLPALQSGAGGCSTEFNQCVFIRYYTMREGLFPKVIRANAGPHNLGSGGNGGDASPELTMRSDAEPVSFAGDTGEIGRAHV